MDELDRRMQRVLDAARTGMSPSAADTERTRRVLLAATAGLAVGVGAGTAAASTAAAVTAGVAGSSSAAGAGAAASAAKGAGLFATISSLSLGSKVVTAVAISASLGGAGVWANQASAPAPASAQPPAIAVPARVVAAPVMAPTPAPIVAPIVEPLPETTLEPRQVAPVAPRAALSNVEKPSAPDPLAAELVLIERARQGLRNGQPSQALAALAEHRAKFEHGVLAQERAALRALALCSLGDPQGKAEAERFLERNPGSPLATHLRTGCK